VTSGKKQDQPNVVKTQEKRQLKKSMALAEAVKRGLK
jgi:hypothetical protein